MRTIIFLIVAYYFICFNPVFGQEEKQSTIDQISWTELHTKGIKLYKGGKYQAAIKILEKAQTQAKKEFDTPPITYAYLLNSLATSYQEQGLYSKAESLYSEAIQIVSNTIGKKNILYAAYLNNLALVYRHQASYFKADSLYTEAKNIISSTLGKQSPLYAQSLNHLAGMYKSQGLYTKAESLYVEAKNLRAETLGTKNVDYAFSLNNLATLYDNQGLYAKAESLYVEAQDIILEASGKKHPDYALSLNNLAFLYSKQGLYVKAEPLYIMAKNIRSKALGRKHPSYALSLNNLASLYSNQGLYAKAEPLFIEAKNIRGEALGKTHPYYAQALNNLASLYSKQGSYAKAESLYVEAKGISAKALGKKNLDYAQVLNNLAFLYNKQDLYAEAEPLYIESKNIRAEVLGKKHPRYASSLNNLAFLYDTQGLYAKAEPLYIESKNIRAKVLGKKHPDYATSLNNLARLYDHQDLYIKAKPLYIDASQILLQQVQINFNHLSEKEKQQFLKTFTSTFELYNSFTLKAHIQIPSLRSWIYNIALTTKGLLLQSTQKMRRRILNSKDDSLKRKFESWQIKRNSLAQAYNLTITERKKRNIDIIQLETEVNSIEKELSLKSQDFARIIDETRYTWQEVQQKLKPSEAAIEIIRTRYYDKKWTDSVLYIALIVKPDTKDQPEMVVLANGNELEKKYLFYYRNQIRGSDKLSYGQYWQVIAEKLKGIRKVYLSLDGVYHQINLNTLKNPKTGKYLLKEIDIHLLGSTRDLMKESSFTVKNFPQKESVILGYPLYDLDAKTHQQIIKSGAQATRNSGKGYGAQVYFTIGEELADLDFPLLEGTKLETQNIHQLFKSNGLEAALYQDKNALEEVVKQVNNPKVLHLATHGFFFEKGRQKTIKDTIQQESESLNELPSDYTINIQRNPMMSSGLVFTGVSTYAKYLQSYDSKVSTEDGILTAYETQNLNLDDTELVVLSACQTGQGSLAYGEGVYGLQRGFQVAGAKTIIMSLWSVNDTATQKLMTIFYKLWLSGKDKRKAFRLAQKKIQKEYKYPYYWGAFVMVGE